jgi:hypothetical protein
MTGHPKARARAGRLHGPKSTAGRDREPMNNDKKSALNGNHCADRALQALG